MEIKDLIEGEYYYERYSTGEFISKSGEGRKSIYYIRLSDRSFNTGGEVSSHITELRLATPKERRHLDLCIAANKYVDCPKEINLIEELIL